MPVIEGPASDLGDSRRRRGLALQTSRGIRAVSSRGYHHRVRQPMGHGRHRHGRDGLQRCSSPPHRGRACRRYQLPPVSISLTCKFDTCVRVRTMKKVLRVKCDRQQYFINRVPKLHPPRLCREEILPVTGAGASVPEETRVESVNCCSHTIGRRGFAPGCSQVVTSACSSLENCSMRSFSGDMVDASGIPYAIGWIRLPTDHAPWEPGSLMSSSQSLYHARSGEHRLDWLTGVVQIGADQSEAIRSPIPKCPRRPPIRGAGRPC